MVTSGRNVMTAIDLLYDEAAQAKQIIGEFKPAMSKADYLTFARCLFKKERCGTAERSRRDEKRRLAVLLGVS